VSDDGDGFDADAFARAVDADASGSTTSSSTSTTENHAAAEGTEASDDVGSTSTLREMLLSTDPADPLEQVESPWHPDRGGPARIYRGIMKATGVDGMPAVADIIIGMAETIDAIDVEDMGEQADGDDGDDGEAFQDGAIDAL
jgi:hypothetical protein